VLNQQKYKQENHLLSMFLKNAQGTIEYLVILAVIIVISLIVIGLLNNQTNLIGGVSETVSKTNNLIGASGISVIDTFGDEDNNSLLLLKNNTNEKLKIIKIKTDTGENEYNHPWNQGNTEIININGLCDCEPGILEKTCNFKITYLTQNDLEKLFTHQIKIKCETTIFPNKPIVDPIQPFTFKIETTENNQEYKFWIDDAVEMQIDWDTGNGWENLTDGNAIRTKTYTTPGKYYIKLKGQSSRIVFGLDFEKEVNQRATHTLFKDILTPLNNSIVGINSTEFMFSHITPKTFTSTNFLDETITNVTNMKGMFYGSEFNQDISSWNTSNVEHMEYLFAYSKFNQPINNWNTNNVTNMQEMFTQSQFNQPINNWNTNNVTNMMGMFALSQFNQPINNWNTNNVTNMQEMFIQSQFNQPINNWNTNNVTNMQAMFEKSQFNQPINNWNVSNVEIMEYMFYYSNFNQPLMWWDTDNVITMTNMFYNSTFGQDIRGWRVTNVIECTSIFDRAPIYDIPSYQPNFVQCTP
jgi:surface protein